MVGIGVHVKVWQETVNGGLQMIGHGVIQTMGMGKLVLEDGLNRIKFNLNHVIIEEDNGGNNTLRSGTVPKPAGAHGKRTYHKQKAHFHKGGGYTSQRYLIQT